MGSRERDRDGEPQTHHQVSSMVVRPSDSGGGDGSGGGGGGGGSDYEQGEVRRGVEKRRRHEDSLYARSDRYYDNRRSQQGYEVQSGSASPLRPRRADHHYGSDYDNPSPPHHGHGFGRGREPERIRDLSPPYGPGRGGPSYRRDFDRPGIEPMPFRGEGLPRNNPNVSPREGDWICSNPRCGNLNFARRSHCNHCKKFRYESEVGRPVISPRRSYPGPPPLRPPPRMSGPPLERGPRRDMNGYGSPPPRGWGRGGPREFAAGPMSQRHGGRFPDNRFQMERIDYREEDFRDRGRFERPLHPDWVHRDRGRDEFLHSRREYSDRNERGLPSPPPPQHTHRDQWVRDARERSRSPVRSGGYKDFRSDSYMGRGRARNDRRGGGRGRMYNNY